MALPHFLARYRFAVIFLAACLAWAAALVMQHVFGMEPCSLCILQRWALTAVLLGAAVAGVHDAWRPTPVAALWVVIPALAGWVVAVKHLMLQLNHHVSTDTGCGFGGEALLDALPLTRALPKLFAGSGECATLPPVMGLPLPAWTAALFVAVVVFAVYPACKGGSSGSNPAEPR